MLEFFKTQTGATILYSCHHFGAVVSRPLLMPFSCQQEGDDNRHVTDVHTAIGINVGTIVTRRATRQDEVNDLVDVADIDHAVSIDITA